MKTTKGMRVATVWKEQIRMWDDTFKLGLTSENVKQLKVDWCEKNDYNLELDCFFCDVVIRKNRGILDCDMCPGRKVSPRFHCNPTNARGIRWYERPIDFHAKLHRMNVKRLKMNREKKG